MSYYKILFEWKIQIFAYRPKIEMRSSLVVRASNCQCSSCNGPGFDPSIRRHSGIWGAADEAVLKIVRKKNPPPKKKYLKKNKILLWIKENYSHNQKQFTVNDISVLKK